MTDPVQKKKMTLDRLARMVADGFEEIENKMATKDDLATLKVDLKALERKVDKIDLRVDEVYDILKRFEETDILNLQKRVRVLEKAVRSLLSQSSSK